MKTTVSDVEKSASVLLANLGSFVINFINNAEGAVEQLTERVRVLDEENKKLKKECEDKKCK